MAKRKYTRKQLRQPDEFMTVSQRAFDWARENVLAVSMGVIAALLVFFGYWGFDAYKRQKAEGVTVKLTKAIDIYNASVITEKDKKALKDDGIPRFTTRKDKLEATVKALAPVATGKSKAASLAHLMRAGVSYDLGKFDEAVKDYQSFISGAAPTDPFRVRALEGLAYCYVAQKKWDQALQTVAKMPQSGQAQYEAKLREATILLAKGDTEKARKRLKDVADNADSRALVERANRRLSSISGS